MHLHRIDVRSGQQLLPIAQDIRGEVAGALFGQKPRALRLAQRSIEGEDAVLPSTVGQVANYPVGDDHVRERVARAPCVISAVEHRLLEWIEIEYDIDYGIRRVAHLVHSIHLRLRQTRDQPPRDELRRRHNNRLRRHRFRFALVNIGHSHIALASLHGDSGCPGQNMILVTRMQTLGEFPADSSQSTWESDSLVRLIRGEILEVTQTYQRGCISRRCAPIRGPIVIPPHLQLGRVTFQKIGERHGVEFAGAFHQIHLQQLLFELAKAVPHVLRIRQVIEPLAPRMRNELAIQDQAVGAVNGQRLDAEFPAQTDHPALPLRRVGRPRGECLTGVLFEIRVAAPVLLFFQQQEIPIPQKPGAGKTAHATAHNHDVVPRRSRRP
jgi:hypothetical protein